MLSSKAWFANFTALLILTATLFSGFILPQTDFSPEIPLATLDFPTQQKDLVLNFAASGTFPLETRLFFTGNRVDIPANWHEDTNFRGRYIEDGNLSFTVPLNNGNVSHSHPEDGNSLSHTHDSDHTHDTNSSSDRTFGVSVFDPPGIADTYGNATHGHINWPSAPVNFRAKITLDSTSATYDANSMQPPFFTIIVIAPDDDQQTVWPDNTLGFLNDFDFFTDLNDFVGVPAFKDRLLFGADIDQNGSELGGDLNGHWHFSPDHNNLVASGAFHTHPVSLSGPSETVDDHGSTISTIARFDQHHLITLTSSFVGETLATNGFTNRNADEPEFITWLGLLSTADVDFFDGAIVGYVGTPASIPSGWIQVQGDALNKQIRSSNFVADINVTGGTSDLNHLHTFPHTHDFNQPHNHPLIETDFTGDEIRTGFPSSLAVSSFNHDHTTWQVESVTVQTDTVSAITAPAEGRYSYRTMIFIMKLPPVIPIDSCTYSGSGNWVVDCQDTCLINSDVDLISNGLILINSGSFELNAVLRRITRIDFPEAPDICTMHVYVYDSGGFEIET